MQVDLPERYCQPYLKPTN